MCSAAAIPFVLAGTRMAQTFQAIKNQNKSLADQANQIVASAQKQALSSFEAILAQQQEINVDAAVTKSNRSQQGRRERAILTAMQSMASMSGNTFMRQQATSAIQQDMDTELTEYNRRIAIAQGERDKRSVIADVESAFNQARTLKKQQTPAWSTVLQVGLAGFEGYTQGKAMNAKLESPAPRSSRASPEVKSPISQNYRDLTLKTMEDRGRFSNDRTMFKNTLRLRR